MIFPSTEHQINLDLHDEMFICTKGVPPYTKQDEFLENFQMKGEGGHFQFKEGYLFKSQVVYSPADQNELHQAPLNVTFLTFEVQEYFSSSLNGEKLNKTLKQSFNFSISMANFIIGQSGAVLNWRHMTKVKSIGCETPQKTLMTPHICRGVCNRVIHQKNSF